MDLAFKASDLSVRENRWIASLSDGTTVFENHVPNSLSAWQRLKKHLAVNRLFITGLRLQAHDKLISMPSLKGLDGFRQIDGYWQSKRVTRLSFNDDELFEHGVGYIKNNYLHIVWLNEKSENFTIEVRPFDKGKDMAHILYE